MTSNKIENVLPKGTEGVRHPGAQKSHNNNQEVDPTLSPPNLPDCSNSSPSATDHPSITTTGSSPTHSGRPVSLRKDSWLSKAKVRGRCHKAHREALSSCDHLTESQRGTLKRGDRVLLKGLFEGTDLDGKCATIKSEYGEPVQGRYLISIDDEEASITASMSDLEFLQSGDPSDNNKHFSLIQTSTTQLSTDFSNHHVCSLSGVCGDRTLDPGDYVEISGPNAPPEWLGMVGIIESELNEDKECSVVLPELGGLSLFFPANCLVIICKDEKTSQGERGQSREKLGNQADNRMEVEDGRFKPGDMVEVVGSYTADWLVGSRGVIELGPDNLGMCCVLLTDELAKPSVYISFADLVHISSEKDQEETWFSVKTSHTPHDIHIMSLGMQVTLSNICPIVHLRQRDGIIDELPDKSQMCGVRVECEEGTMQYKVHISDIAPMLLSSQVSEGSTSTIKEEDVDPQDQSRCPSVLSPMDESSTGSVSSSHAPFNLSQEMVSLPFPFRGSQNKLSWPTIRFGMLVKVSCNCEKYVLRNMVGTAMSEPDKSNKCEVLFDLESGPAQYNMQVMDLVPLTNENLESPTGKPQQPSLLSTLDPHESDSESSSSYRYDSSDEASSFGNNGPSSSAVRYDTFKENSTSKGWSYESDNTASLRNRCNSPDEDSPCCQGDMPNSYIRYDPSSDKSSIRGDMEEDITMESPYHGASTEPCILSALGSREYGSSPSSDYGNDSSEDESSSNYDDMPSLAIRYDTSSDESSLEDDQRDNIAYSVQESDPPTSNHSMTEFLQA